MTVPYLADMTNQSLANRRRTRRSNTRRNGWLPLALVAVSVLIARRFIGRGGR
jgi:hypothetical protein